MSPTAPRPPGRLRTFLGTQPGGWVGAYAVAVAGFVVVDLVWLTVVAADLYDRELGGLLTNLSVLEGFPASLVPVDLAWGAVLSCVVATVTTLALRRRRFGVV